MFIDEIEITVEAGKGGDGKVSFFPMRKGPSGGNGATGGNVYIIANPQLSSLSKYSGIYMFKAGDGEPGQSNRKTGAKGEDLVLDFPIGTVIHDSQGNLLCELTHDSKKMLVCLGGIGGKGNDAFKSSTNQTPKIAEKGKLGQEKHLKISFKLSPTIAFVGLPNVGKSSLLNVFTAAKAKTADYPFTTLEPNLGVLSKKVIADIPGLIEGASTGRGLGHRFLKHIESVKLLLHCISSDSSDPIRDFELVQKELATYDSKLPKKKVIILLTKSDLLKEPEMKIVKKKLAKLKYTIYPISIYDKKSIQVLEELLLKN